MVTVLIDVVTPCLKDAKTGELYGTEVVRIKRKSFLSKFNKKTGWHVNWSKFDENTEIYALTLAGTMDIQGMIALKRDEDAKGVYISWACASPENDVYFTGKRKFYGVGGHLIAIAAEKSMQYGYGGFLHADAVDAKLLQHFVQEFHGFPVPYPQHPNHFLMDGHVTKQIREVYDYEWTDDEY